MDTAYIDYIGGRFEVWFYSEGDHCRFGHYHTLNEAQKACRRGKFDKVVVVSNKVAQNTSPTRNPCIMAVGAKPLCVLN